MDLDIGLIKYELEEIVKSEPLSTEPEHNYIPVNNGNIVKTECKSVSSSLDIHGSVNDNNTVIEKQLAALPNTKRYAQVDAFFLSEHSFKEESQSSDEEHSQVNDENFILTFNSTNENLPIDIPTQNDFDVEPFSSMKVEPEEELQTDYQSTLEMSIKNKNKPCENSTKKLVLEDLTVQQAEPTNSKNGRTRNSASCNQTLKANTRMRTLHYCPYCNRNFTRRDSFSVHLWKRHSKKNSDSLIKKFSKKCFICDICQFKSHCTRSFKSHMLLHETLVDTNTFKCNNCDYESSKKCYLRDHIQRKHSNDKDAYSCRFCNKTVLMKESLAHHLLCQHGEKFDKSLKTLFSLTIKHCKFCDFRTVSKYKLGQHMSHHGDSLFNTGPDTITFKCNNCDYESSQKCYLRSHIQKKHSRDRESYSCRFCNKTFFAKPSLGNHLLRQHGDKFDKSLKTLLSRTIKLCQLCDFRVIGETKLKQHIQRNHSNDRPIYLCRFCNKMVFNKGSLADHLLRHHSDKFDKSLKTLLSRTIKHCKLCDFRTIFKLKLDQHMSNHDDSLFDAGTDTIIFKCYNCDYETFQEGNIRSHIERKHSNDRYTYSCRFCNKTFLRKRSVANHFLCQHGENFDNSLKTLLSLTIKHCKYCDFRTMSNYKLGQHMSNHGDAGTDTITFKCNDCDYETFQECNFRSHIQRKHSNDRHTYSCRFCDKTLLQKTSLADHLLCQHGDKFDNSLKTLLSMTIKHCKLCDFRVISKNMLNHHIQSKHADDRPTYTCNFCSKTFCNKVTLAHHLLYHHGQKFDKSLKTILSLTIKHCKLCDFRVISQSKLNHHIQTKHSNDRPTHTCRFCNKTWFKKVSLANHLLYCHGDKFDKSLKTILSQTIKHCKLCDFRTTGKPALNQHIITHDK